MDNETTSIDVLMHELFTTQCDVDDDSAMLLEMQRTLAKAEESFNRLEHIKASIEEFGISQPMMEALDPSHELTEAGIITDYSELSIVHTHDTNSQAAVEGIIDIVVNTIKAIIKFLKNIYQQIKRLFSGFFNQFKQYEKVLLAIRTKLTEGNPKFDIVKLGKITGTVWKPAQVTDVENLIELILDDIEIRATTAGVENISYAVKSYIRGNVDTNGRSIGNPASGDLDSRLETIVKSTMANFKAALTDVHTSNRTLVKEYLGIAITLDPIDNTVLTGVERMKPSSVPTKQKYTEAGWTSDAIKIAIDNVLLTLRKVISDRKKFERLADTTNGQAEELKSLAKDKFFTSSSSSYDFVMDAIRTQKTILNITDVLTRTALDYQRRVAAQAVDVGRSLLKCKRKK